MRGKGVRALFRRTLKTNAKDYGANYREGDSTDTYRWTPPAISGIFEVYAWWVADKKYSKVANYTISHNGGSNVVVKGHDNNGGAWQLLGTYVFNGSGTEKVQLHSADGKKISADAIRFKQLGGSGGSTITTVGTYFVHTDHLGTPRSVSNDAQTVVWRWDSGPFGHSAPNEDPDGNSKPFVLNLRFPGQYFDAESALNYNYFRDYDPGIGRYITSDPAGLAAGLNTYAYVTNNPLRFIDLLGLAYFAKRPLEGKPWMGPASCNPFDDMSNTEISHEQIFFEDGKSPSNIGFFDDGTLRSEPNPTGYRCRTGKYNDCIMRKAVEITEGGEYCLVGIHGQNNCQDWAARVRANYSQLSKNPGVQEDCQECKQ